MYVIIKKPVVVGRYKERFHHLALYLLQQTECILCTGKNDAGPNGSYRLAHHTCDGCSMMTLVVLIPFDKCKNM